jgi:hypothetical protein
MLDPFRFFDQLPGELVAGICSRVIPGGTPPLWHFHRFNHDRNPMQWIREFFSL